VKWSDHHSRRAEELRPLADFAQKSGVKHIGASSRTSQLSVPIDDVTIRVFPLSLHCYRLGWLNVSEARLSERLEIATASSKA
jgi:hypothetical protein